MRDLPGALDVATEVGRIATSTAPVRGRAAALLESLRPLFPFQGASIGGLDTDLLEFDVLADTGYDARTLAYYRSPDFYHEVEACGLTRDPQAVCLRDLPVPAGELRVWAEYLQPAGFRDAVAVTLFTPDGRYLGLLGLHAESPDVVTDEIRDFLGWLAPTIANAIDPLQTIGTLALMVADAYAGTLLTRAGHCLPLPGLPTHRLLAPGSAALTAVGFLGDPQTYVSFLCPDGDGYARMTVLACPADAPRHLRSVVLLSPPGDLHGLTRRELEVLGLLVEGWPNQRIAAELVVTERTVASHLEHILAKLAVPSRTLAAVRAVRRGLYLPFPLNGLPR